MSTYLVLKYKCTFKTPTFTTNEVGQQVPTFGSAQQVKCEFLNLATNNKIKPVIEDEDIIEVIIADTMIPTIKQQITNIVNRYGTIVEPGPLEIIAIRKYAGYTGKIHHYRLRTRRLRGLC